MKIIALPRFKCENISKLLLYLLNKEAIKQPFKTNKMKQFKLSFEDKNGNQLTSKHIDAEDQREADAMSQRYFATSQINDLFIVIATEV